MAEPSTSQNQNHTTTTTTTAIATVTWGTLEELLLASAVQRYGTNSWDSIAKELQNRTTFSLLTPVICQQKYRDLKRRFAAKTPFDGGDTAWLDELRSLRVAELRRELQRYDLSIVSLQLKVKKLKEQRESSNNNDNNNVKELEIKDEEELEKTEFDPPGKTEKEKETIEIAGVKTEPVEPTETEVERPSEPVDGLCNSAESTRSNSRRRVRVDSDELVESVAESKDDGGGGGGEGGGGGAKAKKESSDVQSTVSLWRTAANINKDDDNDDNKVNEGNDGGGGRSEKRKVVFSGTSSGEENQSAVVKASSDGKSEALVEFLEVVRGRKIGSFFERRLLSQETQKYKSLIKQHIDLETIQKRLEEGQYSDCQTKFYRDFMLLINNAIIFFTRRSAEHKAALELRQLLSKQFQSHMTSPPDHKSPKPSQPAPLPKPTKPEPNPADLTDLKQPKLTITGPVIACRKRSSIAGKSSRGGERKETPLVSPSDEKLSSLGAKIRQQGQKTPSTSFNAVTKKRTRDQSFGSRSSSSKSNRNPSPSTPISGKGENSEAKADKKRQSPGSSTKMKQGSGFGSIKGTLLLESLKNSDRRKTGNDNSGSGNVKSDRRKDEGPKNGSGSKLGKEKGKEREIALDKEKGKGKERESAVDKEKPKGKGKEEIILGKEKAKGKEEKEDVGSRSNRRPPKRAAAIAAMGKRGRDGSEAEPQSKKRQRK